jgi:guanylate kinase
MNTLAELISHYQPTDSTVELVRSTKIALLVGISGAGKDTVKRELLKMADYRDIISHTTRPPRTNNGIDEVEGVDYHFVSNEAAERMVRDHEFVEAKLVHGTVVYGTSVAELQSAYQEHRIAITDIDVQGVAEYKELSPQVVALFILPPDFSTWRARLAQRYRTEAEFQAEWAKRRDSAIDELTHALEVPYYHFIINDELDHTVQIADEIAHKPDVFHRKDDEARLRARDLLEAIKISL